MYMGTGNGHGGQSAVPRKAGRACWRRHCRVSYGSGTIVRRDQRCESRGSGRGRSPPPLWQSVGTQREVKVCRIGSSLKSRASRGSACKHTSLSPCRPSSCTPPLPRPPPPTPAVQPLLLVDPRPVSESGDANPLSTWRATILAIIAVIAAIVAIIAAIIAIIATICRPPLGSSEGWQPAPPRGCRAGACRLRQISLLTLSLLTLLDSSFPGNPLWT